MNHNLISPFILCEGSMEVKNRPKIHHPTGTPSVTDPIFRDDKTGLLVSFKLLGIFSRPMFDSRRSTDDDYIRGTAIPIIPKGDHRDPNYDQFKQHKEAYNDVYVQMIE